VFYVFLLVLAALGIGIYLIVFLGNVPGAAEERLGVLEPLPPDLGQWKEESDTREASVAREQGLKREVRTFFDEAHGRLLRQVRYRSIESNEIVRADPDQVLKRRRVRH
jgi:hypothetical protein